MNNLAIFLMSRTVAVYLYVSFESQSALIEQVVWLKRLLTSAFGSSKLLYLLRLIGMSVPSLRVESTDSIITS